MYRVSAPITAFLDTTSPLSEEFWVNFKVWGLLPITFIFTGFQIGLINKYKTNE